MKNIIELSKETGRLIVTRGGKRVTIYTENARGEFPLQGSIHNEEFDRVSAWKMDGSNGGRAGEVNSSDLVLYSLEEHFDWSVLPGWANMCLFKGEGDWYCSSAEPVWDGKTNRFKVANKLALQYILPEVVTKEILMDIPDEDSLTVNPAYRDTY